MVHRPDDPALGWRYWYLDPRSWRLRSVSQKPFPWPAGEPLRAVCALNRHRAPAPDCNCGIYAARDLPTLRDHGLCLSPGVLVVGRVALWGRVVVDDQTYRGELAAPAHLAVVAETLGAAPLGEVQRRLDAYGVDVGVMALADAVGDVSGRLLAFQVMSGNPDGGP